MTKSQPIPDAQCGPDAAVPETAVATVSYLRLAAVIREPQAVGGPLSCRMRWENVASPPYRPYVLAVRTQQGDRSLVLDTDAKLTNWRPGKHDVDARLQLPRELAAGDYESALGILDSHYREPEVRLAIRAAAPTAGIRWVGSASPDSGRWQRRANDVAPGCSALAADLRSAPWGWEGERPRP